ncbi:MAG TPA: glycosyltransferase [Flavisolibacter sp.]|nr:glycosyltransferase [Flavisolibacter sp.]
MEKHYEIRLYDVYENSDIVLGENDKFLGHYWPDMNTKEQGNNSWSRFDEDHVTNKVMVRYPNDPRVFGISPFNHSIEQNGWAIPLLRQLHCYIGINGDYWMESLAQSPYAFMKGRMFHLNMPIDQESYPRIKRSFGKKGARKFFYIGRVSKEKNTAMLEQIAASSPHFEGGYIGNGLIKGWKQIAAKAALTPDYMMKLSQEYDVFINTSTFDAQATTVLEAMSWGFAVACTPESGYTDAPIFQLSATDLEHNLKMIDAIQATEESELHERVRQYDHLLAEKYTWKKFADKLIKILNNELVQTN